MCGRYSVLDEDDLAEMEAIIKEINRKINKGGDISASGEKSLRLSQFSTGEVFPTNNAPVLVQGKPGSFRPAVMKWGFPRWDSKGVVINAKSETLMDKNMFRNSFQSKRCIIPASGFYEWKQPGGKQDECEDGTEKSVFTRKTPVSSGGKTKFYFQLPDKALMNIAGLWNVFRQPDGTFIDSYVILTAAANESVSPYHDRMPVILLGDEREAWLRDFDAAQVILDKEMPLLSVKAAG